MLQSLQVLLWVLWLTLVSCELCLLGPQEGYYECPGDAGVCCKSGTEACYLDANGNDVGGQCLQIVPVYVNVVEYTSIISYLSTSYYAQETDLYPNTIYSTQENDYTTTYVQIFTETQVVTEPGPTATMTVVARNQKRANTYTTITTTIVSTTIDYEIAQIGTTSPYSYDTTVISTVDSTFVVSDRATTTTTITTTGAGTTITITTSNDTPAPAPTPMSTTPSPEPVTTPTTSPSPDNSPPPQSTTPEPEQTSSPEPVSSPDSSPTPESNPTQDGTTVEAASTAPGSNPAQGSTITSTTFAMAPTSGSSPASQPAAASPSAPANSSGAQLDSVSPIGMVGLALAIVLTGVL